MTREDILHNIMPCGCICYTCLGCGDGVIATHAKEMLRYLDGYDDFLKSHTDYKKVSNAIDVLQFWSAQSCPGCRVDGENRCRYADCKVRECSKRHNVEFCYLCKEYPCDTINANAQWREANDYMLAHGQTAFFENESRFSHYRSFKNNNTER